MNNRQSNRRRGRGNNRPQNNRGGGFDHQNTIDNRSRGNANQMLEKFKKQANDAQLNGDRVNAEYYLQFADHYFRVLADFRSRQEAKQEAREQRNEEQNNKSDRQDNGDNDVKSNDSDGNDSSKDSGSKDSQGADEKPRRGKRPPKSDVDKGDNSNKPKSRNKKAAAESNDSTSKDNEADSIDIAVLPPSLSFDEEAEVTPKKRAPRKKIIKKPAAKSGDDNAEDMAAAE